MRFSRHHYFNLSIAALLCLLALTPLCAQQKERNLNLIKNGHFDDPEDPLNHWIYVFDHNVHYMKNHEYVSVIEDKESMRQHVLMLDASIHEVCINQGVQIYTAPIRFNPKMSYKISLSARSIGVNNGPGPKCRMYPIGYRWHPKATKSNNPAFGDLREAVRFQPLYFNNAKTGEFSNVPRNWKRIEYVFPDLKRSELQQSHLENCEWLMFKIVALDATGVDKCNNGYLYVDDVVIEEMGPLNTVDIRAGAATKGFEGRKSWSDSGTDKKPFVPIGGPVPSSKKPKK